MSLLSRGPGFSSRSSNLSPCGRGAGPPPQRRSTNYFAGSIVATAIASVSGALGAASYILRNDFEAGVVTVDWDPEF